MQRGMVTLEIVFAITIIAVLIKSAVPNADRIIDTVALDYEMKQLYSELRFVKAEGRNRNELSTKGMGDTEFAPDNFEKITLIIDINNNSYKVCRVDKNGKIIATIRETHYFSHGVTVKLESGTDAIIKIHFGSDGKANINSDTLTLTSRLGKKRYIRFNSVGRFRASLTNTNE